VSTDRSAVDGRFPWPAQVMRDSTYLMRAVTRISHDPNTTPEEMSRRLRNLQSEGCLPIDAELTPGTEVYVVSPDVTPRGDVYVRYWSHRHGSYETDRFPLTCLGPRRRKGARTRPDAWMEAPWAVPPKVPTSAPSH